MSMFLFGPVDATFRQTMLTLLISGTFWDFSRAQKKRTQTGCGPGQRANLSIVMNCDFGFRLFVVVSE